MQSINPLNKELRETVANLDGIFQMLPDAVVVNTLQRRIIYVNRVASEMFGYTVEELFGHEPRMLYADEDDYHRLGQIYGDFESQPQLPAFEVILQRKNGGTFTAEIMGAVMRGQDQSLLGFLSIIRDITERKAMEDAIRVKEAQLRQIIDLVPHMIFVKNREGRFLLTNKAVAEMYGTSVHDLTGSLIHDHHRSRQEIEQYLADDAEVLDSGQPKLVDEEIIHDFRGEAYTTQTIKIPYTVAGAEEPAVLGIAIDITRQKQAESMLRQTNALLETSRNALRNIIEQLPIGIQIFDQHGTCTGVNQAHLDIFGVDDASQLVNTYNIFEDDLAEMLGTRAAAERALQGEVVRVGDVVFDFSQSDGRFSQMQGEKIIDVIILPILDQEDKVTSIVGLNTDVTERKLAEQTRLDVALSKERIDVLEELISTISHDFKTPLTIIGTSLYLFEKVAADETASKHIRRIEEQLGRLGNLINGLLMMSHLIGVSDLSFSAQDINQIVYNVYSAKTVRAEEKSLTMTFDAPEVSAKVLASDELTTAFTNLVDNAISFTPPEGAVSVSVSIGEKDTVIEVADTGVGIAEEDLSDIFERFYRTDKARSTDTGGAGLGLAIAKQIIDMHHGTIEVSSVQDEGSTFRVTLPLLPDYE